MCKLTKDLISTFIFITLLTCQNTLFCSTSLKKNEIGVTKNNKKTDFLATKSFFSNNSKNYFIQISTFDKLFTLLSKSQQKLINNLYSYSAPEDNLAQISVDQIKGIDFISFCRFITGNFNQEDLRKLDIKIEGADQSDDSISQIDKLTNLSNLVSNSIDNTLSDSISLGLEYKNLLKPLNSDLEKFIQKALYLSEIQKETLLKINLSLNDNQLNTEQKQSLNYFKDLFETKLDMNGQIDQKKTQTQDDQKASIRSFLELEYSGLEGLYSLYRAISTSHAISSTRLNYGFKVKNKVKNNKELNEKEQELNEKNESFENILSYLESKIQSGLKQLKNQMLSDANASESEVLDIKPQKKSNKLLDNHPLNNSHEKIFYALDEDTKIHAIRLAILADSLLSEIIYEMNNNQRKKNRKKLRNLLKDMLDKSFGLDRSLTAEQIDKIRSNLIFACLVHDIGKAHPDVREYLSLPRTAPPIDEKLSARTQQHVIVGSDILNHFMEKSKINDFSELEINLFDLALQNHHKFDNGLSDSYHGPLTRIWKALPKIVHLMSISDCFEAITSNENNRKYNTDMPTETAAQIEKAINIITKFQKARYNKFIVDGDFSVIKKWATKMLHPFTQQAVDENAQEFIEQCRELLYPKIPSHFKVDQLSNHMEQKAA